MSETMKRFSLVLILLALLFPALKAQETTASISGTVRTEDGTPLPGVHIIATSPSLIGDAAAVTDGRGSFRFIPLPPGEYKLNFTLAGFAEKEIKGIALSIGRSVSLKVTLDFRPPDLPLSPGVPLDMKNPAQGLALERGSFQPLPKGRSFASLAVLAPGFGSGMEPGGLSAFGASAMENKYYIDGVDVTDIRDGALGQAAAVDFIDDARFDASGVQASSPGALGGVVSVVTRSGGDRLRGEVVGYYSGSPLRARPADILALDPEDDSRAIYLPYRYFFGDNDDSRLEAGFSLGGAIFRDRLWFFGSFMPAWYAFTRTLDYGTFARDWKRAESELNFLVKLNARPLKNLRLGASLLNLFHRVKGDLPSWPSDWDPYISYNDYGFSYPNLSASFSADWSAGHAFQASARAGYFRSNQNDPLVGSGATPYYYFRTEAPDGYRNTTPAVFPEIPPQYLLPPYGGYTGTTRPIVHSMKRNIAEKLSLAADASLFFRLAGEHRLQAGVSWARRGQDVDNTPDAPIIFLAWDRELGGMPYFGPRRGKYGYYAVRNSELTGPYGDFYKAYANLLALYVQDSWTLGGRLTLTAGLRAESESVPSYATGDPKYDEWRPIRFGLADKLAPRLGLVWDVRGDSSLRAFASFAVFHDEMKLAPAAGWFGGSKWRSAYYTLDTYEWDKIGVDGYFPGDLILPAPHTLDFRAPDPGIVDPDLKPMTQGELSLGLEKRLGRDIVFSARYVRRHLLRAIEDVGVPTRDGEKYFIANPGSAFIREKYAAARAWGLLPSGVPDATAAKRDYDALAFSLEKRFSGRWLGGVSYAFSQLRGNYAGPAGGSDGMESGTPYATGSFDKWFSMRTLAMEEASGPLPNDRPHRIQAYGAYAFPFGLSAGLVLQAMSGAPTSTVWTLQEANGQRSPFLPFGRGDLERSPFLFLAGLYLEYGLDLGRTRLSASLNIDNLLNARTARRLYPVYNESARPVQAGVIAAGGWSIDDYAWQPDPRYGMACDFLPPLEARLGLRFSF